MLAAEMAKADPQMQAIIIASNKSAAEFPFYLRTGKYIPLYKWVPNGLIKNTSVVSWVLGIKTNEQKKLLSQILSDLNPDFLKWAIEAILDWKEKEIAGNIKHIHGTNDKLLPCRYVKADFTIEGGTHLISINKPNEISTLLKELIQ
jgi:hypothetical protein